ncbi:unnamed protein product [Gongylonema pulchrum]|uniref:BED-type domain-containing protein n=1 Tax=Gongylonema pulchrum TaxID=637853 RepID=A0A183DNT2_9BILA|nr:unnamed protein product [Gongylonema pulchrum]
MHAFYQCTSCDYFCRKEEKNIAATSGQSSSVPARAELKAENGIICGDLYPAHHADCIPTSLDSLRTLGESLRDFHVVRDRRIISLKAVDDFETGSDQNLSASSIESTTSEPAWQPPTNESTLWFAFFFLIGFFQMSTKSTSTTKEYKQQQQQHCNCKRFYEENLEMYQDMVRSLDEMRAIVEEMKYIHSSRIIPQYVIDEGDVLVEDDIGEIIPKEKDLPFLRNLIDQTSIRAADRGSQNMEESGAEPPDVKSSMAVFSLELNAPKQAVGSDDSHSARTTPSKKRSFAWTLVTENEDKFRCNVCKTVIRYCSSSNIKRHYSNNHPDVLKQFNNESDRAAAEISDDKQFEFL